MRLYVWEKVMVREKEENGGRNSQRSGCMADRVAVDRAVWE